MIMLNEIFLFFLHVFFPLFPDLFHPHEQFDLLLIISNHLSSLIL